MPAPLSRLASRWAAYRSARKDLQRIAAALERLAEVGERLAPPHRRVQAGSVGVSPRTVEDRLLRSVAESRAWGRLGRRPTMDETADALEELESSLHRQEGARG